MAQVALAEGHRLNDMYSQRLAVVAMIEAARNEGRHRLALDHFTELRRLSAAAYEAEEIRTLQHLDRYDDAEAMLAKIREAHDDVDSQLPRCCMRRCGKITSSPGWMLQKLARARC
jgi:hypothetical protein